MVNSTTNIDSNEKVTYATLSAKFLTWLKTSCKNIGAYANDISNSLKDVNYGQEYTADLKNSIPVEARPKDAARNTSYKMNIHVKASTALPNSFPVVSVADVETDFNRFMQARGISIKSNTPVIATGLLAFWNNVASFCSARIYNVAGMYATSPIRIYKKGGWTVDQIINNQADYKTVPSITQDAEFKGSDVTTLLNNLETIVAETSRLYAVTYDFSNSLWSSSCCSSSCSSSSSSSSSSSCSCIFIGYMKLPN